MIWTTHDITHLQFWKTETVDDKLFPIIGVTSENHMFHEIGFYAYNCRDSLRRPYGDSPLSDYTYVA